MAEVIARTVTAEELAALQAEANKKPNPIPPGIQAELDRMQKVAAEFEAQDLAGKIAMAGVGVQEPASKTVFVGDNEYWNDPAYGVIAERTLEVFNGVKAMQFVMGPPKIPTELVIADIFKDREVADIKLNGEINVATVCQYVRSLDGQTLPGAAMSWQAVEQIYHRLGPLGFRVANQIYNETWPASSGIYWREIKKNSPERGLPSPNDGNGVRINLQ